MVNKLTRSIMEHNLPPIFTTENIKPLEPDDNARYGQMKRALASGDIIKLKRGVYTLSGIFRKGIVNEYILANQFNTDSYISLETAFTKHNNFYYNNIYVLSLLQAS
ncbi:hypothetical protein AGMMS4952_17810 [Spirochaetia bacterium]|nr:hypothetical protein AGMMS4952_17810 [Spirochaetia bacterium]